MKHTLLACLALSLFATTGCATSVGEDEDGGFDEDGGVRPDAPNKDSATNKDGTSPGQCVSTCQADEDCQNSCPNVPNGINCCDTSTGICYAYSAQECPAPVNDAGFD